MSDRLVAAYFLMMAVFLAAAAVLWTVFSFIELGPLGLAITIPMLLIVTPLLAWLVWEMVHTFVHNDVLWNQR